MRVPTIRVLTVIAGLAWAAMGSDVRAQNVYLCVVTPASVTEGNSATVSVTLKTDASCTTDYGGGDTITFDYTTGDVTATGSDYTTSSANDYSLGGGGSVNLPAIATSPDVLDEDAETFSFTVSDQTAGGGLTLVETRFNGAVGSSANITIDDDDSPPTVSFDGTSVSVSEGNGNVTVRMNLSAASGKTVTVPYSLSGTATNVDDYTPPATLSVIFNPGSTSKEIITGIVQDALDEANETVIFDMGTPTNATESGTQTYQVTISDDDPTPTVTFTAGAQNVGEAAGTATVTAELSAASGKTVTVPFTLNGSSSATEGGGDDFTLSASPLTIGAGSTTAEITITVISDALDEVDETVIIDMGTPTNAGQGGTTQHTATIQDDDAEPTVTFTASAQDVGEAAGTATVTAQLSPVSGKTVTVPFTLNGSSSATQGGGNDFTLSASPLTINAGSTSANVTITINNDGDDENDETVIIDMGAPTNAGQGLTIQHTATIKDDDVPQVTFDAANSSGLESSSPSLGLTISPVPVNNITLNFTYGGGAAGGGTDYTASATLNVTAGSGSANLPITVVDDRFDESNETVVVTLGAGTGYAPSGTTVHTYTITDNDADLSLVKDATSYNADTGAITWRLRLTNSSGTTAAANVTVTDPELDTAGNAEYAAFAAATTLGSWTGTVWTIPSIGPGVTATATITTTLQVETTVTNTAYVSASDQGDPDSSPGAPAGEDDEDSETQRQYDYGDVPAAFGSTARHELVTGAPVLGSTVDSDSGSQSHANALGDDNDADGDDDDSVTLPSYVGIGVPTELTVAVSGAAGFIHAWVDYDGDNVFEAGEKEHGAAAVVGNNTVTITPPSGSVSLTSLRIRVCSTSSQCDSPEELASDGEVEDYEIMIIGFDFGDAPAASYATLYADDGARHKVTSPVTQRLGSLVDADDDAQHNATATGDDTNGAADEDGISFLTTLVVPAAGSADASVNVTTYGAGVLYAWLDSGGGVFTDGTEEVISGASIGTASTTVVTTVTFGIPSTATAGTTMMRFRFCSTSTTCSTPTGFASDGEVEDYQVTLVAAGAATAGTVQLPVSSNVLSPATLVLAGTTLTLSAPLSGGGSIKLFEVPDIAGVNTLAVTGTTGGDKVLLDYSGGDIVPSGGFTFNAGDGGDELEIDLADHMLAATKSITYNGGGPTTGTGDFLDIGNTVNTRSYSVLSVFTNEADGTVTVDDDLPLGPGAYDDLVIAYTGLEPIFFTATAAKAEFHFNGDNNAITLNADGDGDGANGFSFIDCTDCGESMTFDTPSDSLTVRPGAGDDTITFPALDTFAGAPTGVQIEGDAGSDLFIITPNALYAPNIAGEDPVLPTCNGDTLDLVTEGGITDHSLVYTSVGNGYWDFTAASNMRVTFSSIETQLDARTDISVAVTSSDSLFYPTDPITATYSVTNTGFEHATCVNVTVSIPDVINPTEPIAPSRGFYTAPSTWLIPWLQSGVTGTMEVTGIMDAQIQDEFLVAASASVVSIDSISTNNADTIAVSLLPTIPFPAKAHPLAALQVNLPSGLERVIVGLAQGSPGLSTGVLCRIPDPDGVLFTQVGVGNRWRACGEGLPHPIYVTDLFLDDNATPSDSTDDRVWLGTWGSDGLYVSDDLGESFVTANAALPEERSGWQTVYEMTEDASGIFYLSANSGIIFRSFDRGDSWQRVASLPGASADTPWALTAHPTNPGVLYAGLFGRGVYVSLDYGFNWEPLGSGAVNLLLVEDGAGHVFELEFSPDSDSFLFAATSRGVWRIRLDTDGNVAGLWREIEIRVTLASGIVVTPEVRSIAFDSDTDDSDDDLAAGTWGFGAYGHQNPLAASPAAFTPFALRESEVSLLLPVDGGFMVGTSDGAMDIFELQPATSTTTEGAEIPTDYALGQNYPNPFNPQTTIVFDLPVSADVRLLVYDMLGREVAELASGTLAAGRHTVQFNAADLPSGSYIYRLTTPTTAFTRQLVLMK